MQNPCQHGVLSPGIWTAPLLDTEPVHRQAHAEQCQALGLVVSDERIEANVGLGDEAFYRHYSLRTDGQIPAP